ncbi:MAG: hypothetical protein ACR2O0_11090, partial [Rhizobiaceae bacterium]
MSISLREASTAILGNANPKISKEALPALNFQTNPAGNSKSDSKSFGFSALDRALSEAGIDINALPEQSQKTIRKIASAIENILTFKGEPTFEN